MPAGFDRCVKGGGRVRTISGPSKRHGLGKDQFTRFCFLNGESFKGETKTKKAKQEMSKRNG